MSQPDDPFAPPPDPNQPNPGQTPGTGSPPPSGYPPPPVGSPPPGYPPPPQYPAAPGQGFTPAPPPPPGYGYGQGAPGGAPPGMHIDPGSGLMFPDGVELASVGRRIGAYFLAIPLAIVTLVIGYLIWGGILWGRGTSPSLKVLKMKVWRPSDGRPATFWQMVLRDLVGGIVEGVAFGILGLVSFIMFLSNKEHKALHDMIGSTVVVYDPNRVLG